MHSRHSPWTSHVPPLGRLYGNGLTATRQTCGKCGSPAPTLTLVGAGRISRLPTSLWHVRISGSNMYSGLKYWTRCLQFAPGMCDQLSSIGVEFNLSRVKTVFLEGLRYSAAHPFPYALSKKLRLPSSISELCGTRPLTPWAAAPIFQQQSPSSKGAPPRRDAADCDGTDQHPSGSPSELQTRFAPRPWSLGQTRYPTNALLLLAGTAARTPGRAVRVDSDTNADIKNEPLLRTGERIHSSVRVRLACGGLGTDDGEVWRCEPLTGSSRPGDAGRLWRLERGSGFAAGEGDTPKPRELARSDCPESLLYPVEEGDSEWRWVFSTKPEGAGDAQIPRVTMLPEEPMVGYWERYLLALTTGTSDVWRWAQQNGSVSNGKASG